jgi:hypothetical protein
MVLFNKGKVIREMSYILVPGMGLVDSGQECKVGGLRLK